MKIIIPMLVKFLTPITITSKHKRRNSEPKTLYFADTSFDFHQTIVPQINVCTVGSQHKHWPPISRISTSCHHRSHRRLPVNNWSENSHLLSVTASQHSQIVATTTWQTSSIPARAESSDYFQVPTRCIAATDNSQQLLY